MQSTEPRRRSDGPRGTGDRGDNGEVGCTVSSSKGARCLGRLPLHRLVRLAQIWLAVMLGGYFQPSLGKSTCQLYGQPRVKRAKGLKSHGLMSL
ncbi:unnamed protein product [Protopolystoma xenopodis]|uniref:Uncharacterized protein n=1 Tax=Protopolystoma xenopodis TaxID=117903 RepID=A0A3S5FGB1_9PLAT|nr:unnamed protein product [Protopolystoma xenopodis]